MGQENVYSPKLKAALHVLLDEIPAHSIAYDLAATIMVVKGIIGTIEPGD